MTELVDDDDGEEVEQIEAGKPLQFVAQPPIMNWNTLTIHDFAFEIMIIGLVTVYLAAYYKGKRENEMIARKWLEANKKLYEDEFAQVGDDHGKTLIFDGPKDYIFYATGRDYVQHVYGLISLKPRHDLIARLFDYFFGASSYDKVSIIATMNPEETDSVVFGILPRSKVSDISKSRWDLDQFAKAKEVAGFPKDDFVLLTENPEVTAPLVQLGTTKKMLWNSLGLDQQGKGDRFSEPIFEQMTYSDISHTKPETYLYFM
jgi:hypothetical protein